MAEAILMRSLSGLIPADEQSAEVIYKWPLGQGVRCTVVKVRSLPFHRKAMSLLRLGFDAWEPPSLEWMGKTVERDFDQFRRDVVIQAGFYSAAYGLNGEVRLEAESLAFENMDEDRFRLVYDRVLTVIWDAVLSKQFATKEFLDQAVNRLQGYV